MITQRIFATHIVSVTVAIGDKADYTSSICGTAPKTVLLNQDIPGLG